MSVEVGKRQRAFIDGLLEERSDLTAKDLSDAIGRNASYVQQFLRRGTPVELKDRDFEKIRSIAENGTDKSDTSAVIEVPVQGFRGGMGGGGVVLDEAPAYYFPIRREYIRQLRLSAADLIMIEVEGDSMSPTLESGDLILINQADKNPARGGVFTIFDSDTVVVKRIEKIPATDPPMIRLISDNRNHSSYDVLADDTFIVGRVVWFARRM
jgi:phage repressor protein C with HTH and peptisase S24 domain